ncbi:MAG TPA: two-component regulator propeller domain-containing protein [Acidobacteriaceae bacterium]|nr:two-component regulator propeller domain-containing protein [Acidobacteriaceae bacterium]
MRPVVAKPTNLGMTHHTWGLEDGLPDRVIQAIAQTPDGYLWLGTPHGLVRFDGFKFVNFGSKVAPSLNEFGVSCLLVGTDGTLWIGSVGGGVTHLSSHSAAHFGIGLGLEALTTRALYQSTGGTIWAGTDSGLYKLVNDRFTFVSEFGNQNVTAMVSDGADGFWVAGVSLTHYQHGTFQSVPLPPLRSVIRSLAMAPDGALWIGALGTLLQLKTDGSLHVQRNEDADVRALCFDQNGSLWIGTIGEGLLVRSPDGGVVRVLEPDDPDRRVMRAISVTRNGDLWIGTHAGLIRMSHTGIDFLRIPTSAISDFGSVFVDRDDSVWLCAGDVSHYVNGEEHRFKLPSLATERIRVVYRDHSGAFWVGTVGNGAYRLVHERVVAHLLASTAITSFHEAPDGSIWIGSDHGLARWNHGKFAIFPRSGESAMSTVKSMALAADGSVWIATPAGLFLFRNDRYLRPELATKLAQYRVWSLYADTGDALWIGTGSGLYLWRGGKLTHLDLRASSFQSQAIVSILIDAEGRFLFAEPEAVFRVTRQDVENSIDRARKVDANGIQEVTLVTAPEIFAVGSETGTELYSEIGGVGSADRQGGAWYATYQGLLHIAALPLPERHVPPPLIIERVLVDGSPVSSNGSLALPPSTHNLQIQVAPILLSDSAGLRLRSRLIGFDDKWNDLTPGSPSSYGSLAPGRYTFKVEAYWPPRSTVSSAQLTIAQQSAFYRRKSFIAFCCALAALLAWLFYRFRIHQMRLRFNAVADERNRVAREIHDTLLQGCIGAVSLLEALEISYERARDNSQSGNGHRSLTVVQCVREQLAEAVKEAREAIWSLRSADDQKPLDIALRDALQRLTNGAEIATSFRIQGERVPISPRVQHEIIMTAREAIMNAVSHAHPKTIEINLQIDSSSVIVAICDDGIGFDSDAVQLVKSNHFGLSGMRDRMRRFRGSMTVESARGRGTRVQLSLPLSACRIRARN